jgi:oligopeptide transport system substrate-binding protein
VIRTFPGDYTSKPSPFTHYYWVDVNRAPMENSHLRQALARAIDRPQLVDNATRGLSYPATGGLVPPGMPGHVPGIATPADPAKARRLLAQAGFPGGDGLPPIKMVTILVPILKAMTDELARQWREVLGIQVEVSNLPSGDFRDHWLNDPPHVWMLGWTADYPDPYNFLNDASWRPIGGWRHETYDKLISDAWKCSDRSDRLAMYAQAEQILVDEAPVVPLAYPRLDLLIKPWIKNWKLVGTFDPFFPHVVIEPHQGG